jgi:hypothetical protein
VAGDCPAAASDMARGTARGTGRVTRTPRKRPSRAPQVARNKAAGNVTTMEPSKTFETKTKRGVRKGQALPASDAYETWLDHRLKSLYQPILEAPLPEDMLKLLRSRKPS